MSRAIKSALRIARRYADGGSALFDPTPMNPPKTPNQRVMEGHQEYEQGYGHVWGGRDRIMLNSRGQYLQTRKAADGGGMKTSRTAPFPEKPEGYEFTEPDDAPVPEGSLAGTPQPTPTPEQPPPAANEYELQRQQAEALPDRPPTMMQPDLTAQQMQQQEIPEGYAVNDAGVVFNKETGEELQPTRRPSVLPVTKTPEGRYEGAMPRVADIAGNMGAGWSVPTHGAEAVLGAGLAMPKKLPPVGEAAKPPIPPQLHFPEWAQSSQSKGTGPGALFTNTQTGQQVYAKVPHSTDHLNNELMASEFYKLSGIPAAEYHATKIKDAQKLAIASDIIPGKQLSEFPKADYNTKIKGLREGRPIDAFLANWDVVGAGHENPLGNIIVDANGIAHRIDFGGALRFGGMGGEKGAKFNANVDELTKMMDYGSNKTAASIYDISHVPHAEQMNILQREKEVAARVAGFTDNQIDNLVHQYGPAGAEAKDKLYELLIARRERIAQEYGVGKYEKSLEQQMADVVADLPKKKQSLEELQNEWEAKLAEHKSQEKEFEANYPEAGPKESDFSDIDVPPGGTYTMKDLDGDTKKLLANHKYGEPKDFADGIAHDTKGMAHDLYKMAEKNPDYVDQVTHKIAKISIPLHDEVQNKLSTIVQRQGDPWAAPDKVVQAAKANEASAPIALMKLNKTHTVEQFVNTIKDFPEFDEFFPGKMITQKQKDNIAAKLSLAPNSKIAAAIKDFTPEEKEIVLSWVPSTRSNEIQKILMNAEKIKNIPNLDDINKSHSLEQILQAIKNYSPQYAEVSMHAVNNVPKVLSKYSPAELKKAIEPLPLNNKEKIMQWLPQSTKEKMAEIGAKESVAKKGFIPQEYYDALEEPIDWAKYTPKDQKHTSFRKYFKGPTLAKILGQGYNPDVALFKGGKYDTYPKTILDPVTEPHRLSSKDERAFFLTHEQGEVTGAYGNVQGKPYIARPEKVFHVKDYGGLTGNVNYDSHHMIRLIEAAREKGADLLIIDNITDVKSGGHGHYTQYAFLNTNVLRGPEAKFDPTKLHLREPLAGLVGGGLFSYGMLKGQEDKEGKMARGGQVSMPYKSRAQAAYFNIHRKEMEAQGVDVGEWNSASKGMKLPKHKNAGGAIASALATARKYAKGGISTLPKTPPKMPKPPKAGGEAIENLALKGSAIRLGREGLLNSSIPGRTDKLPMNVKAGSYVLPGDIPSALGQGNTMAGGDILKKMFSSGPYGMSTMKGRGGKPNMGRLNLSPQRMPKSQFQQGGEADNVNEGDEHVPIIAAGGEFIVSPEVVRDIGHGDMKKGHDVLDRFVLKVRKHNIKTLKSLPPPKK